MATSSDIRFTGFSAASAFQMRSSRGALGAVVLLLPFTIAVQLVLPNSDAVVIHLALALGTLLVGLSAFDFQSPRWMAWTACVAASVLAAIFFAQALASLTHHETLLSIAFS